MDVFDIQQEILRIRSENINIGTLLHYIKRYDAKLKWAIQTVIYWLKSENTPLFRNRKHQKSVDRKYWHEAAEILGLKHFTVEYTQCRHFCTTHNKYCSKWKHSAGKYSNGRCYDSDHECSGDNGYGYDDENICCAEKKEMTRRNVYILSPELTDINDVEQLEIYLKSEGYMNKPPFVYPYKPTSSDGDYY
jgi:hypothetical protein